VDRIANYQIRLWSLKSSLKSTSSSSIAFDLVGQSSMGNPLSIVVALGRMEPKM